MGKKFTLLHRLLHWTMTLAMFILFITGFLRMYWMNRKHMVELIKNETSTQLSAEQMNAIAKAIRAPM